MLGGIDQDRHFTQKFQEKKNTSTRLDYKDKGNEKKPTPAKQQDSGNS